MRRLFLGLILAATLFVPMDAMACNGDFGNGTVPVMPRETYTVALPATNLTFYVDDRDWLDIDRDGYSGGLWIYMESNGVPGLQPGGEQYLIRNVILPYHEPISTGPITLPQIQLVPPNPVLPQGLTLFPGGLPVHPGTTLFPGGIGGGSLARAINEVDYCFNGQPDTLIW